MEIQEFFVLQLALVFVVVAYLIWPRKGTGPRLKMGGGKRGGFMQVFNGPAEKNLNVIFTYNAHTFDAHEVLGIPAGCSLEDAKIAFEKASQKVTQESRSFLSAALKAIEDNHRS